jgi:BolA protein
MIIQNQIKEKLSATFSPTHLEVFDESYKHAGHAGAPEGSSETHIGIIIVSDYFAGLSRIERSRAVHKAIAEEIKKIHALTVLKTLTPEEY